MEQYKALITYTISNDNTRIALEGELCGGKLMVTLSQTVKSNIYGWAIKPWVKKDGAVLFKTGTSGVVFDVKFTNAACINMERSVNIGSGLDPILK